MEHFVPTVPSILLLRLTADRAEEHDMVYYLKHENWTRRMETIRVIYSPVVAAWTFFSTTLNKNPSNTAQGFKLTKCFLKLNQMSLPPLRLLSSFRGYSRFLCSHADITKFVIIIICNKYKKYHLTILFIFIADLQSWIMNMCIYFRIDFCFLFFYSFVLIFIVECSSFRIWPSDYLPW